MSLFTSSPMEKVGVTLSRKPWVGITMGDPAGVGPEIVVRALVSSTIYQVCRPVVLGHTQTLARAVHLCRSGMKIQEVSDLIQATPSRNVLTVINCSDASSLPILPGRPSRRSGTYSIDAIHTGVALAQRGEISALATAPISKKAIAMAGFPYPGHTELLAELTRTKQVGMLMIAPSNRKTPPNKAAPLRILLVTTHIPIEKVPSALSQTRIAASIRLAHSSASGLFGIQHPRIAVASLNPHAGEAGRLGFQERTIIGPAIAKARREGIDATGPFPSDSMMLRVARGEFDMAVAMYHDQALIPIKLLSFGRGVNLTVGIPLIRTSVDHGTAYDIAWKGKANPNSLIEAIVLAAKLGKRRR